MAGLGVRSRHLGGRNRDFAGGIASEARPTGIAPVDIRVESAGALLSVAE